MMETLLYDPPTTPMTGSGWLMMSGFEPSSQLNMDGSKMLSDARTYSSDWSRA